MLEKVGSNGIEKAEAKAADVFEAFERSIDGAEATRRTYARALRQYASYIGELGIGPLEATRETVVGFKRSLAGKAPSTVNAYLTAVRSLYAWLEAERVYPNVAATVKGERRGRSSAKDALTVGQAKRLLADEGEGLAGLRDRALIALLLRRGLRTIEAARANVGDVRQVAGQAVLFVQGKGYADKGDFVVLGDDVLGLISDYLAERGVKDPDAPLFASIGNRNQGGRMTTRSISRIVKEAMKRNGISSPTLTAHSLRHTAVTFALMGGASVQEAQAMARHASINTTMIYAHNLDRMRAGAERGVDSVLAS